MRVRWPHIASRFGKYCLGCLFERFPRSKRPHAIQFSKNGRSLSRPVPGPGGVDQKVLQECRARRLDAAPTLQVSRTGKGTRRTWAGQVARRRPIFGLQGPAVPLGAKSRSGIAARRPTRGTPKPARAAVPGWRDSPLPPASPQADGPGPDLEELAIWSVS